MITKRRVSLSGVQLDSIDERIIIQSAEPAAGKDTINTVSQWGADGSKVTGIHRDYLDVTIKFAIRIKADQFADRSEVFEKVSTWAMGGGWLRMNTKPGRRLRVICAQLPAEGDAMAWNSDYSITFRAYGVPYWQDESASQLQITNTKDVDTVYGVPGNADGVIDFQFQNTSGSICNDFKITAGKSKIVMASLGLKDRETLIFDHNDNGRRSVVRIRILSTSGTYRSVLSERTAESSNDLAVSPGETTVTMTAGRKGDLLIGCNGRFA